MPHLQHLKSIEADITYAGLLVFLYLILSPFSKSYVNNDNKEYISIYQLVPEYNYR